MGTVSAGGEPLGHCKICKVLLRHDDGAWNVLGPMFRLGHGESTTAHFHCKNINTCSINNYL